MSEWANDMNSMARQAEKLITCPVDLIKFYMDHRHFVGWPSGDAIAGCLAVLEQLIPEGACGRPSTVCLSDGCPVYVLERVTHVVQTLCHMRVPWLDEQETGRLHETLCKLIREILQPPAKAPQVEPPVLVEPVEGRVSPDGLTSPLGTHGPQQYVRPPTANWLVPVDWLVPRECLLEALKWVHERTEVDSMLAGDEDFIAGELWDFDSDDNTERTDWGHVVAQLIARGILRPQACRGSTAVDRQKLADLIAALASSASGEPWDWPVPPQALYNALLRLKKSLAAAGGEPLFYRKNYSIDVGDNSSLHYWLWNWDATSATTKADWFCTADKLLQGGIMWWTTYAFLDDSILVVSEPKLGAFLAELKGRPEMAVNLVLDGLQTRTP